MTDSDSRRLVYLTTARQNRGCDRPESGCAPYFEARFAAFFLAFFFLVRGSGEVLKRVRITASSRCCALVCLMAVGV